MFVGETIRDNEEHANLSPRSHFAFKLTATASAVSKFSIHRARSSAGHRAPEATGWKGLEAPFGQEAKHQAPYWQGKGLSRLCSGARWQEIDPALSGNIAPGQSAESGCSVICTPLKSQLNKKKGAAASLCGRGGGR